VEVELEVSWVATSGNSGHVGDKVRFKELCGTERPSVQGEQQSIPINHHIFSEES
jgi:hypothetical protein